LWGGLVGDPKFLLIDEPYQGFGRSSGARQDIGVILKRLREQVSAIIVEQNLAMVKYLRTGCIS